MEFYHENPHPLFLIALLRTTKRYSYADDQVPKLFKSKHKIKEVWELLSTDFEHNAEWVFFLDTDCIVQADGVWRLMSHNLPIVSGVYYSKTPPIVPTFRRLKDGTLWTMSSNEWPKDRIFEVDAVGMGCCLINSRVFRDIEPPWFHFNDFEIVGAQTDYRYYPRGFQLLSGAGTYNRHKVVFQDVTLERIGNYWVYKVPAIDSQYSTAGPIGGTYSKFTADSLINNVTFIYGIEYMTTDPNTGAGGNSAALRVGDSFRIENCKFRGGFLSTIYCKEMRGNEFGSLELPTCRSVNSPIQDAVIEDNTIYGHYCKTFDAFTPNCLFQDGASTPLPRGRENLQAGDRSHTEGRTIGALARLHGETTGETRNRDPLTNYVERAM